MHAAFLSELPSQKHGVISGKPQQREGETHTEGERGEEWNKLPLTMIFIGLLVFDSSPFLCSFLTFHKWLSTLEHIVKRGQQVPQKLAVTSAGPIHTRTPSIALCQSIPGSAL